MTLAIAGGLLASGFQPQRLRIAEPFAEQRERLKAQLPGVAVRGDNDAVAAESDCLVLATKPQVLAEVCRDLAETVQRQRPLLISIAAGIRGSEIDAWLGGGMSIVRVMPNQPALLQLGASGMFANAQSSSGDRDLATMVMGAVGKVVWVDTEADIDAVTAISGSGPAYFFLLIDMLIENATAMGIEPTAARELALRTAVGAAALAEQSDSGMDELIARVRSPGGTTAAALDSLDAQNVRGIFSAALEAARNRANDLADEAGK